jgi:hypothetical protein
MTIILSSEHFFDVKDAPRALLAHPTWPRVPPPDSDQDYTGRFSQPGAPTQASVESA